MLFFSVPLKIVSESQGYFNNNACLLEIAHQCKPDHGNDHDGNGSSDSDYITTPRQKI